MRKIVAFVGLAATLFLASPSIFAAPPTPSKGSAGVIVIVFKDGRRQSFNLADISKIEFPLAAVAAGDAGAGGGQLASKGRFLGKWEVGDGSGNNFFITLNDDGSAYRNLGNEHGKWVLEDGAALVTWNDGSKDAIRKVGSRYQKFAYGGGKSFNDSPDNVTNAQNTAPRPI